MSDGNEEREEQKPRREEEKKRRWDEYDREEPYEGQPERGGS